MDDNALTKEILKKRTQQLAKAERDRSGDDDEGLELIVFLLGNETYGLEASGLKSIRSVKDYIPLPGVAHFIKGITNIYGVLYTVVDLKKFLGLTQSETPANSKLLIVDHESLKVCFLVDQIMAFKKIPSDALDTKITGIKSMDAGLIKGITNDTLIVLNMDKMLDKIARESKEF